MILRNVAIRHGRKAVPGPVQKPFLRFLTTEPLQQQRPAVDQASINQLQMTKTLARPRKQSRKAVVQSFEQQKQVRRRTGHLGAVVEPHYEPHHLLVDPPKPEDVTLELLMASQAHLGHSTSLWNPMNQRYIFGIRDGIHIISLETTAAHLRRAAKVVEGVAYNGGLILFVGTRPGQGPSIVKAAELAKGCHLFERWIAGTITNGDTILAKCEIVAVDKDDEQVGGYDGKIAEWRALKPDLVVCLNPLENYILLHECGLNNIPTVGIIDTDADPTWVTYPIPANDDSLRCTQLIAGVLGRAAQAGQEKRLEAAKTGVVTWLPPPGLGQPFEGDEDAFRAWEQEQRKKAEDRANAAGVAAKAKVAAYTSSQPGGSKASGRVAMEDIDDL